MSNLATVLIFMIMGYAIAFSYFLIALRKKELGYLRNDSERSLKYFKEGVERDFERLEKKVKRLQEENDQLQRTLICEKQYTNKS